MGLFSVNALRQCLEGYHKFVSVPFTLSITSDAQKWNPYRFQSLNTKADVLCEQRLGQT